MREGRNLVGVDIGTSGVKVCQIKESRKGLGLVRLGFVPLSPQVIVDGQVMDAGAVSAALEKAFRDAKIKQRAEMKGAGPDPFIDHGCKALAATAMKGLEARIAEEKKQ